MLSAPVSENKTKEQQGKAESEFEMEGDKRSGGWAGYGSLSPGGGRLSAVSQVMGKQAVMQKAYGNQAMLRMMGRSPVQTSVSTSPLSRGGILQRKSACGNTAGSSGSCAECQEDGEMAVPGSIQTKLTINEPGDHYEQEADRVAEQVLAAPAHPAVSSAPPRIQRFTGQVTGQADMAAPASVDRVLSSPGSPLEPSLQQDMGQRFGHDFSSVRVHTDAAAERSAQDVNANAYTVGHNIVFGAGRYAPGTHEGRRLVAHELTHVLQQDSVATRQRQKPNDAKKAGQSPKQWDMPPIPAQVATGDALVTVQGDTGLRVARNNQVPGEEDPLPGTFSDTPFTASTDKTPALTPNELMERLVVATRAFEASPSGAPINTPKGQGSALGAGYKTYAGVQIIDKEGNQVISAIGRYLGGGKAHAEDVALQNLYAALQKLKINVAEMRMMVVVDQIVCKDCTVALEKFAEKTDITQIDVYLTSRDGVTSKTAGRTAVKVGAQAKWSFTKKFPSKLTAGIVEGGLKAPVEEPPVATADKPPTATTDKPDAVANKPVDTSAPDTNNKPAAANDNAIPSLSTPANDNAIPRVPGAANDNAIPSLSTPANDNAIPSLSTPANDNAVPRVPGAAESSAVEGTIAGAALEFVAEQAALLAINIALQWVLARLFDLALEDDITNILKPQIINKLGQLQSQIAKLQGTKKLFIRITYDFRYQRDSPDDPVREFMQPTPPFYEQGSVRLVNVHPGNEDLDFPSANSEIREPLFSGRERVTARYSYSLLLDDAPKRSREKENLTLIEKLRKAPPTTSPSQSPPSQPTQTPPLLPSPGTVPATPSFDPLPGAPGLSPMAEVEVRVAFFKTQAVNLLARGEKLLSSSAERSEIDSFEHDEGIWRDLVTLWKNNYTDKGPDFGRDQMDELLNSDQYGGRLKQIRQNFGG